MQRVWLLLRLKHRPPSVHRPSRPANRHLNAKKFSSISMEDRVGAVLTWTVVSSVTRTQCFVTSPPDVSPRLYSSTFHRVWRLSSISPLMWICLRTRGLISLNGQSRAHGTARCIFLKMYFFIFLINYFCLWSISSCRTVKIVKLALMLCNCCTLFNVNLRTKRRRRNVSF